MSPGDANGDEPRPPSFGNISEHHWTRARAGANREALDYYRERSRAPGVEGGGGPRNHYCLSCNGVLPLEYDSRVPAEQEHGVCPHCGVALQGNVRAMFNWVEIDQVPPSDARAVLPWVALGVVVLGLLGWLVARTL